MPQAVIWIIKLASIPTRYEFLAVHFELAPGLSVKQIPTFFGRELFNVAVALNRSLL
jgi:hypothetical protein